MTIGYFRHNFRKILKPILSYSHIYFFRKLYKNNTHIIVIKWFLGAFFDISLKTYHYNDAILAFL